ncbi:MAG: class I SAM-dependent methyltransferase [Hyphomicrobium sp.]|jgi:2-polyprenyl-3-methyl-5-hydroxy-6-metoxy-1,4-benzoquinol methylase
MRNPLFDDPDRTWERYGSQNPYFAVITCESFDRRNMSRTAKAEFFATGARHVGRVMEQVRSVAGEINQSRCLDFGCGVGRLAIPFSKVFERVVGVDVSRAMLDETRFNAAEMDCRNIDLAATLDEVQGQFDLVHSYIVLQHIEVGRGLKLIKSLFAATRPGGVCWLHLTIDSRRSLGQLRRFLPLHYLGNIVRGQPVFTPLMQMNPYPFSKVLDWLYEQGVTSMRLDLERHGAKAPLAVCMVFKKPE